MSSESLIPSASPTHPNQHANSHGGSHRHQNRHGHGNHQFTPNKPSNETTQATPERRTSSRNSSTPSPSMAIGRTIAPLTPGASQSLPGVPGVADPHYNPLASPLEKDLSAKARRRARQLTSLGIILALVATIGLYYLYTVYRQKRLLPSRALQEGSLSDISGIDPMLTTNLDKSESQWKNPHPTAPTTGMSKLPSGPIDTTGLPHVPGIDLAFAAQSLNKRQSANPEHTHNPHHTPTHEHTHEQTHEHTHSSPIGVSSGSGIPQYPPQRKWRLDEPKEAPHQTI